MEMRHSCAYSYLHCSIFLAILFMLLQIHICNVVFSWQFCSWFWKFICALLDFLCKLFMLVQIHIGSVGFSSLHPQPSVPETNANKSKILRFLDILFHKFIQSSESGWKNAFSLYCTLSFGPRWNFSDSVYLHFRIILLHLQNTNYK